VIAGFLPCVSWSIADHLRTELILDAIQIATWRRQPASTIAHGDHGPQFTS
jgi:putative transposase